METLAELDSLGLNQAAKQVRKDREVANKLRIAFEHFRRVTPENIERFKGELQTKTRRVVGHNSWGDIITFDSLLLVPLEAYPNVPPKEVLEKIREAKALECFDTFEVATVQSIRVIPDPVVFGRISGSPDRYFVAEWDNDLSIADILREDEG